MQLTRNKILRYIKQQSLFNPGDTVIVALSGGADSMALLDILAGLPGFHLTLVPAHLNHSLRGDESDGDELFVRRVAARYGLVPEVRRVDVTGLAKAKGLSLEEAGREARYGFFRELAGRCGAAAVALGHHREDQAETVLLRLLRGAAGSGLAGMRPCAGGGLFVRPLLDTSRREIEAYLGKAGIDWREDSSNTDINYLRNRIRHELVPLLRTYNPRVVEVLNNTAFALAADDELLCAVTADAYRRCATPAGAAVMLDLQAVAAEHDAFRPRLYRLALAAVKGDLRRISFRHVRAVESLVAAALPNGRIDLPDGIRVTREYERLLFTATGEELPPEEIELTITHSGSFRLPCGQILTVDPITVLPTGWRSAGPDTIFVRPEALPFPWTVRYFRAGDRFMPLGMEGEKKLKDLFIDRKIPLPQRRRLPLLLSGGRIFWIGGVQPSELARLAGDEQTVVRINLAAAE